MDNEKNLLKEKERTVSIERAMEIQSKEVCNLKSLLDDERELKNKLQDEVFVLKSRVEEELRSKQHLSTESEKLHQKLTDIERNYTQLRM